MTDSVVPDGVSTRSKVTDQSGELTAGTHDETRGQIPGGARAAVCELAPMPEGDGQGTDETDESLGLSSDVHSRNNPGPGNGKWSFAIPIMVLAGTPAGPPSAPRRQAAHQFRGIAGQQGPRDSGLVLVCEKSLYEDRVPSAGGIRI